MATVDSAADDDRYQAVYDSAEFQDLRRRSNTFIGWTAAVFYGWWLLVIALAAFVPSFFATSIGGPMNVGLVAVMISFALVVAVSALSLRHARTQLDPLSDRIRADVEGDLR
jgi:uncharacterized membrane protein (DUF485 family)